MSLTYLSGPARAGLWGCPVHAVCQSTDHNGWVLVADEMSPRVSLWMPHLLQHFREHLLERRIIALKLRVWPRAWSVLVSLLCSVLIKIIQTLEASEWCLQLLSLGSSALPTRGCCSTCWRGWGCLGSNSSLTHVPLWPAIPWSLTRLIRPGTLEAKLT